MPPAMPFYAISITPTTNIKSGNWDAEEMDNMYQAFQIEIMRQIFHFLMSCAWHTHVATCIETKSPIFLPMFKNNFLPFFDPFLYVDA